MNLRRAIAADLGHIVALQRAAYAPNREILGVEPLPLMADYAKVLRTMEVWLAETDGALDGVLILEPRSDDLLIWSIATDPARRTGGLGRALLETAAAKAREKGYDTLRLYTGTKLAHLVAWYGRHGYVVERIEELPDRSVTHMVRRLTGG
jgi:GNAT superfamily N-acetyltransferase